MKYALLIYSKAGSHESLSESEGASVYAEYVAISQEPACVGSAQLQPIETATTVRSADGQTLITDGPFADTKEVFGGFYLVESADLDGATATPRGFRRSGWAARWRCARSASCEAVLDRVFAEQWARVLASLVGLLGDFDLAEEAAAEAFAAAAARWPPRRACSPARPPVAWEDEVDDFDESGRSPTSGWSCCFAAVIRRWRWTLRWRSPCGPSAA